VSHQTHQAIYYLRGGPRGVYRLFNRFRPDPHARANADSKLIPHAHSEPDRFAAARCPAGGG
jgi:hypothetical protein